MRYLKTAPTRQPVATPTFRGRLLTIALWALQLGLAFLFFGGGSVKLAGAPEMVAMFATIGAGQWLRFVVGTLEIAGALGLLIPRLAGLAALGLVCLLVGAIATNILILRADSSVALGMLLVGSLIAWGRRDEIVRLWQAVGRRA